MKKSTLILVCSLLISLASNAQLSGSYTIGGTTPDYASIQTAITALQVNGVNGAVIFNIRSGTYTGKVSMGNVVGASAANTITFQSESGDSTDVIIADSSSSTSSSNFTVLVNGTDYVTFQHLTIERIGSLGYATVIYIGSGSKSFQVKNCILRSGATTNTGVNNNLIYIPLGNSNDSNIVISSNILQGGSYGIYMIGQGANQLIPGVEISNNRFIDNYFHSILLNFHQGAMIVDNEFSIAGANTNYAAIELSTAGSGLRILRNNINSSNGNGILQTLCVAQSGSEGLIANNFISIRGNSAGAGIYFDGSAFQKILHNSILCNQTGPGASAMTFSGAASSEIIVFNNLLIQTGGGFALSVAASATSGFTNSDYNDLYVTPGDTSITSWGTATQSTLADWQTASAQDQHSVTADPQFISSSDLHVGSPVINNAGLPFAEVADDIDGEVRDIVNPDLGADEFIPLDANIGLIAFVNPESGSCGSTTTEVGVLIKNYGQLPQTNIDVKASVTGAVTTTLTDLYTATLGPGTTDTLRFAQTIDTYAGGTIDIAAWSELVGDQYLLNDTIRDSFDFGPHPNPPVVQSPQQQCNTNLQITAQADSGDALAWYSEASGGTPLFVGDVFSPIVFGDTTFYVETRQGSGTSGCLRITEIEPEGGGDYIEIQNLSGGTLDASGWKVFVSNDYNNINLVNSLSWDLGVFTPGEVQYRTDDAADNYWGNNILWSTNLSGWAIIIDNNGIVIDFIAWDWDSTSIQAMSVTLNNFPIVIGSEWIGEGVISCPIGNLETMSRTGTEDQNIAVDFTCIPATKGVQNPGLASILQNCGIGACASQRIPIDITLIAGVSTSLGNDTVLNPPFSFPLDAGAGFTSYLWNDGSTTQTIVATIEGIYWVTVTGPNGCTFTDSLTISIPVGLAGNISEDAMSMSPNPASNQLMISGGEIFQHATEFRLFDLQGREIENKRINAKGQKSYALDLSDVKSGLYFIQMIAPEGRLIKRFAVIR